MPGLLTDALPGSPSAISQMLGLLMQHPAAGQPGQPAPPPVAPTPMPQQAAPEMPAPPQNLLGKIHDFISDRVGIKQPGGYGGLLSPEEIQQAKPGILAAGAGDSWTENLNRLLAVKGATLQAQEHQRVMQARQNMPQDLDLPAMLKYATAHGDMEMVKTLGGAVSGMLSKEAPNTDRTPRTFTVDGKAVEGFSDKQGRFYTADGAPIPASAKVTPYVAPHEGPQPQIVQGIGPDGKPAFFRVPRAGGAAVPIPGLEPKQGSNAQNAQGMAAEALLRSSVSEMTNADTFMKSYENDLASGKKSINGLSQFMGGIGNSFTHDDFASRAVQNTALTALNKINPDLARYIRRGLSFAEGEAGISKRPSDFRTKMAAFLSTAASGASPEMITDIQGRRNSILNPLHEVLAGGAKSGSSKPKLTQAQYDAGRAKGHSQAEIASHYDLTGINAK